MSAGAALAQVPGAPLPIPVPPIPAPPQLGRPPAIALPSLTPPGRPVLGIPDPVTLSSVTIPPEAPITPADKNDPVPPPQSAALTAAPPIVAPGDSASQISASIFIVDPGTAQLSPAAVAKLATVAKEMAQDTTARVEIRTFSPSKSRSESNARRLSLSRFLAVRDVLVQNGVGDDRIDGRPLVSPAGELNADRVELYIEH